MMRLGRGDGKTSICKKFKIITTQRKTTFADISLGSVWAWEEEGGGYGIKRMVVGAMWPNGPVRTRRGSQHTHTDTHSMP